MTNLNTTVSVNNLGLKFFREEESTNYCPSDSGLYKAAMSRGGRVAVFHDGMIIYLENGVICGIDHEQWWSSDSYFSYFDSELEYKIEKYFDSLPDEYLDARYDIHASWEEVSGCDGGKRLFLKAVLLAAGRLSERDEKYIKFLIKHGENAPWFIKNHKVSIGSMPTRESEFEYFPEGAIFLSEEEEELNLVSWTLNSFPIGELLSA
jgi:hypothetical protein